jgi:hypothetical protein
MMRKQPVCLCARLYGCLPWSQSILLVNNLTLYRARLCHAKVSAFGADVTNMEYRRREPRFETDQLVSVTNLEQPGLPVLGRLVNFSARGTKMRLSSEIRPGTMVKVDLGGTILLGEIIYCKSQGQEFAAGMELEDALYERELLESMSEAWVAQAPTHSQRQD